jgi:hypothetical protein
MLAPGVDPLVESSISKSMNLVAVCAIFTSFYIGLSLLPLRAELLPTLFLLLVVGPLAAIVIGHSRREKKNRDSRQDDGRSDSEDPSEG